MLIYDIDEGACLWLNKCIICFLLFGDSELKDIAEAVYYFSYCSVWDGVTYINVCARKLEGERLLFFDFGPSDSLYNCGDHCYVVLHEAAHSFLQIDDEDEASAWARRKRPECCNY